MTRPDGRIRTPDGQPARPKPANPPRGKSGISPKVTNPAPIPMSTLDRIEVRQRGPHTYLVVHVYTSNTYSGGFELQESREHLWLWTARRAARRRLRQHLAEERWEKQPPAAIITTDDMER